jgi:hypothetical protein
MLAGHRAMRDMTIEARASMAARLAKYRSSKAVPILEAVLFPDGD